MYLESGSLVRNRGIEKNEWGLGTVVLTHPQRLTCDARARAREMGGGKETLALLELKIPFSFSFKGPTK